MALNMPTFYKRTASAVVFGAVMLSGLLLAHPWIFVALIALINVLCLREYFGLLQKIDEGKYWPVWLQVVLQVISLFLLILFARPMGYLSIEKPLWLTFTVLPLVIPILLLACVLPIRNALPALLQSVSGLFYITLAMILLGDMRNHDFVLPIAIIVMIWINDTMAYIVGSFIGKTPFSPISPKKTWEGTAGGAVLTVIVAAIYGYWPVGGTINNSRTIDWIFIATIVAIAGTLGDLLESKLKRLANVKDSGNMMPGHGGALDRFDSLLIAIPFVWVYYSLFM
jgi:phosphatidate cytidylyltransferase